MKLIVKFALCTVFFTSSLLAQTNTTMDIQPLPTVELVSATQEVDEEIDWKTKYEKLEYRLGELEYDVENRLGKSADEQVNSEQFAETTTKELKELNEVVEGLSSSVEDIEGTIPSLVTTTRKRGPQMQLFGRIHTSYVAFSDIDAGLAPVFGANPQDSFGVRRVRIGVKGDIDDNVFYKIQTEFANAEDFQFRDVFLGVKNLPLLNTVIIGNHKRPYNLDQLNSSNDNVFLDRPFVGDAFNDGNRRFGISTNGHTEDLRYNWRSGVFNMENIQDDGMFSGDNYQLEVASRWAATPWYDDKSGGRGYMHLAVAAAHRFPDGLGPNNLSEYSSIAEAITPNILATGPIFGAESESLYGLEAVLNVGAFQVVAEYMETFVDRFEPAGTNLNFHGGYIQAAYMLTGEHMPWKRNTGTQGRVKPFENFFSVRDCDGCIGRGWGAWQVAARYSYLDLNDEDIVGGQADSLTVGLNWFWNQNSRMQFNYINGDLERAPLAEGNYDLFALQFEVFF